MMSAATIAAAMPKTPPAPTPPANVSVAVSGLTPGNFSANAFAGFASPATTVFSSSNFGTAAKYLEAQDPNQFILQTNSSFRDVEITHWVHRGYTFLRVSGGKAIYFEIQADADIFEVGIVSGLVPGDPQNNGTYEAIFSGTLSSIPGYDAAHTAGATFTLGASGWDIYAKFTGVEFFRAKTIYCIQSGQVWISATSGYGYRDVSVTWLTQAALNSYPPNNFINMLDFGLSSLSAVGSMTAVSNQLVLVFNPGFKIGDAIIVEVGGEAGAGLRGTVGVGGGIPGLSYATTAAMNADNTKPDGTFCWVVANTFIYESFGGVWFQQSPYYFAMVMPKALSATITNVVGTTLTLSANSVAATTNANVYFDNSAILNKVMGVPPAGFASLVASNQSVLITPGKFAISADTGPYNLTGWNVQGSSAAATSLFSPKGSPSASFYIKQCTSCIVTDLGLQQNMRNNGYALRESGGGLFSNIPGCDFFSSTNCQTQRVYGTDIWLKTCGSDFSTSCWSYDCHSTLNDGTQQYIQWQFQFANSTGGGAVDSSVTSPYLTAGFESFESVSTTFSNCSTTNATFSSNDGGSFTYENCSVTITPNSQISEASFAFNNPVFNINANIGSGNAGLGGQIINMTVIQQGVINASNDLLIGIIINSAYHNVSVIGTYPNGVNPKGIFQSPDWVPGTNSFDNIGVRSSGVNTIVNGIRFTSKADYADFKGNIHTEGGSMTAENCVMDAPVTGSASPIIEINNQTNAQWLATHY